jgi:hypothetical protein
MWSELASDRWIQIHGTDQSDPRVILPSNLHRPKGDQRQTAIFLHPRLSWATAPTATAPLGGVRRRAMCPGHIAQSPEPIEYSRSVGQCEHNRVLLTGSRCVEITGHSGSGSADYHGLWRAIPSEPVAPLAQRRRVGEAATIRLGPRRVGFTREELPRSGRQTHSTRWSHQKHCGMSRGTAASRLHASTRRRILTPFSIFSRSFSVQSLFQVSPSSEFMGGIFFCWMRLNEQGRVRRRHGSVGIGPIARARAQQPRPNRPGGWRGPVWELGPQSEIRARKTIQGACVGLVAATWDPWSSHTRRGALMLGWRGENLWWAGAG